MTVSVKVSGSSERAFGAFSRRVDIAAQRALLKTANKVRDAERAEMGRVFASPTPWTLNAFRVDFDKAAMQSVVRVKDGYWYRANNYLADQIEGTSKRRNKAFEQALQRARVMPAGWVAVPGQKAKLDAYGNHSVGEIRQILSWFDAAEKDSGSTQNMRAKGREKKRKGTRSKRGFEYFSVSPGGSGRSGNLQPGIYRRTFFAFTGSRGGVASAIEPIIMFVRSAAYRKRYDFYGLAHRTSDEHFGRLFSEAMGVGQ